MACPCSLKIPIKGNTIPATGNYNIANLFNYFEGIEKDVVQVLQQGGNTKLADIWRKVLPYDPECKVNMNTNKPKNILGRRPTRDNYYKCNSCKKLTLIAALEDLSSGRVVYPDPEYTREEIGGLVLTSEKFLGYTEISGLQPDIIRKIVSFDQLSLACNPNLTKLSQMNYYGFDSVTTNLLINWYLYQPLSEVFPGHIKKIYHSFVCGNQAYTLSQATDLISLLEINFTTVEQVWEILFQLFGLLHFARQYELSFDTIENVMMIENKKTNYTYDGLFLHSQLRLILNDFSSAGVNIVEQNNRVYNSILLTDEIYQNYEKKIITWDRQYEPADYPGQKPDYWVSYKIFDHDKLPDIDAMSYTNRMGLPLYQGSFDGYRFLLYLCRNPSFYKLLLADPILSNIFKAIWLEEDFEKVDYRLQEKYNYDADANMTCTKILCGLNLRCNFINYFWNILKTEHKIEHPAFDNIHSPI